MKHSEVFDLLNEFKYHDLMKFKKFLNSSFFGIRKNVVLIYDLIFNNKELLKSNDYDGIISKLKIRFNIKNNILSQYLALLYNSALKFIAVSTFLKDEIRVNLYINEYSLNSGNRKLFRKISGKIVNIHSSKKLNEKSLLFSFLNYDDIVTYLIHSGGHVKEKNINERTTYYYKSINDLLLFTIQTFVFTYCNIVNQRINSGNEDKFNKLSIIPKLFEVANDIIEYDRTSVRIKFLKLYELLYNTFYNPLNEKIYFEYKKFFINNDDILDDDLKRLHFNLLLSNCNIKMRIIEPIKYMKEQLELYDIYMDKEFYRKGSYKNLHSTIFMNYIMLSTAVNKYDKIKSFVNKTGMLLEKREREDLINFALAHYYFGTGEYSKALRCINDIKMKTFIYKYQLITLELKIYFNNIFKNNENREEINYVIVNRILNNYNKLVNNDTFLTKLDKIRLQKMFRYYGKLYNHTEMFMRDKKSKDSIEFLKYEINKEKSFAMKNWIVEIIDEILLTGKIKIKNI